MIKPTVGRIVWYYPENGGRKRPRAAMIVDVHSDRLVNIALWNDVGVPDSDPPRSVRLLQDDDERPLGRFCEWMPYQKGQAAKTEALEERLPAEPEPEKAPSPA